ncbi:hypothetical protein [Verrucomicrobium sp. BvORR106]|uniref:hypothetical protein n=1 Tax=Verrucomicrobium sp. BvORR106 TaxID=1403819 RepID=UPI0005716864|nr:hypothetical protein [Verrucomicrobium sp. BvORR106]
MKRLWTTLSLLAPFWAAGALQGAAPAVTTLYPAGGRPGTTFPLTVTGAVGKPAPSVWADHAGITFKPGAKPNVFEVSLAADTPPGPHLVRFFNAEGASVPRTFIVGTASVAEVTDTEPNDDAHTAAQALAALPVTVNGRLDKAGDADAFKFTAKEGQWLVAVLHGYGLGMQMDPAMRLLDEHGTELALGHDSHNLDPQIAYEIKKTGTYVVQVMSYAHPPAADVSLRGSLDHVYRLTITQEPTPRLAWPPGVKRGAKSSVQSLGWNCGAGDFKGPVFEVDATTAAPGAEFVGIMSSSPEPLRVALHDGETVLETEPNQTAKEAEANVLTPAGAVTWQGVLQTSGDEDRLMFATKKGETYVFKVASSSLHAPLDAWLRVENLVGTLIGQADDAKEGVFDPVLNWKAPVDGKFVLAISDRFQRGGWNYVYQVQISPASAVPVRPVVLGTLAENALKLEAGKTADLKLTAAVTGEFKGKLMASVTGLPAGVTVAEVEVPGKKGGEVTLKLAATAEVVSFSGPVEVVLKTSPPDAAAEYKAVYDLRGVEPRGDRLVNEDSRLWLSVAGKPAAQETQSASRETQELKTQDTRPEVKGEAK